jgi:hypothetical protein
MPRISFLPEKEAPAFDSVFYFETFNRYFFIVGNQAIFAERVKMKGIRKYNISSIQLDVKDVFQKSRAVHMKIGRAVQQAHARKQTDQAKIMVPMQM